MYRAAVRPASRRALAGLRRSPMRSVPQRFASTAAPADKPRSWKSSALRWALAVVAVYYYNTSSIFADETSTPRTIPAPPSFAESDLPTVDAVIEEKRKQLKAQSPEAAERKRLKAQSPEAAERKQLDAQSPEPAERNQTTTAESEKQDKPEAQNSAAAEPSSEALEEEAGQEGAFNPETGEINWDCPCLGGMAHGPCGEEFKTAFSCFVYSNEEPKGMDCINKFQSMQECFRKYPDIYGAELGDDELREEDAGGTGQPPADEHQALRDDVSEPETSNLPGARSVGDASPNKWEDATAANDEAQRAGAKDRETGSTPASPTKK